MVTHLRNGYRKQSRCQLQNVVGKTDQRPLAVSFSQAAQEELAKPTSLFDLARKPARRSFLRGRDLRMAHMRRCTLVSVTYHRYLAAATYFALHTVHYAERDPLDRANQSRPEYV
jgi:hypothetical protein